jgi:hypothetical protein
MRKINQSNLGVVDFFLESTYLDAKGETRPCYLVSKMGCEMVANKLIGEKGILFTAAYVAKFNEMEAAERTVKEAVQLPRLGEYNAAARLIVRAMQRMGASLEQIFTFIKNLYQPLGITIEIDEPCDIPQLYTAKQVAKLIGLYSMNGNPHAHAVACILNEHLFIGDEHKTVVTTDFGYGSGVCVHYDRYALNAVVEWLLRFRQPREIRGFGRTITFCT